MSVHVGVHFLRARWLLLVRSAAAAASAVDPESTRPRNDLPYVSHHTPLDRKIILVTGSLLFLLITVLAFHALIRCILRGCCIAAAARRLQPSNHQLPTTTTTTLKPMKKRHVSSLPSSTFHVSNQQSDVATHCPICLADFNEGELIRVLPICQHGFHVRCVDTWLYKQATCPTCRADLLKGEERSRSVEVHVVITPHGGLCPTLCGEPKEHHIP